MPAERPGFLDRLKSQAAQLPDQWIANEAAKWFAYWLRTEPYRWEDTAPPPVPPPGVDLGNPFGVVCRVTLAGGQDVRVSLDGKLTAISTGDCTLEPTQILRLDYQAPPTWSWKLGVPMTPDDLAAVLTAGQGPALAQSLVASVSEVDRLQIKQRAGGRLARWDRGQYYLILRAPAMQVPDMQYFTILLGTKYFEEFVTVMTAFKAWLLA